MTIFGLSVLTAVTGLQLASGLQIEDCKVLYEKPGEKVTFEKECLLNGGLGCVKNFGSDVFNGCRYCEFGEYSDVPCKYDDFRFGFPQDFQDSWDTESCELEYGDNPGETVTFDPECLDDEGGLGCITEEQSTVTNGCRFCEFGQFADIPCADVSLASPQDSTWAMQVCKATYGINPLETVTFDQDCLDGDGGLGCIADGCRYCGFGSYKDIPCSSTVAGTYFASNRRQLRGFHGHRRRGYGGWGGHRRRGYGGWGGHRRFGYGYGGYGGYGHGHGHHHHHHHGHHGHW